MIIADTGDTGTITTVVALDDERAGMAVDRQITFDGIEYGAVRMRTLRSGLRTTRVATITRKPTTMRPPLRPRPNRRQTQNRIPSQSPTPNLIIVESQAQRSLMLAELDRLATVCDAGTNVLVIGEIRSPGPVAFNERELSLVDALAESGGPNWRDGALNRMLLLRWFPETKERRAFKIDANLEHWGHPEQIWLQPDDILYIPPKYVVVLGIWIDQYIKRLLPVPYLIPSRLLF